MKFGKSLSNQIEETLPEWRDKFISYKELKKKLKLIEPKSLERPNKRIKLDEDSVDAGEKVGDGMSIEETDFIRLLEKELEKFNSFFVEKEEEYIIRLKELQDSVAKANDSIEETIRIRKEIVDFHGEMVLLENYSALNYTGLVKILKKYDKRTGALIRLPFIQRVLQQPFYTTDLLYKLVKECEVMLDHLFPKNEKPAPTELENKDDVGDGEDDDGFDPSTSSSTPRSEDRLKMRKELEEIKYMESLYMKSSISALRVLKEIRSGSSTVSVFSLPPMDETWKTVPVLEQAAK
ncbi:SPX domain gene 1, ARABIDOPSIS THALIANA SPX DOMAIN GENE 1 [Hibiscus trionum]|uniref:SPX domain gene 1, ARABIDOPSIS THALIANA SPX DOMAIN GENE 1 n=1 Tax=Hibiscus trionum TaxID=183268 RepID=A0A9W7I579_HIBTR|nr:SPX domain gene 1, ARABIDOPSIS THALIANA SPX DOMAIN GENE 1 [Hibiscus trionum]